MLKMKKQFLFIILSLLFFFCSVSYMHVEITQKYPVLDHRKEVELISLSESIPPFSNLLGTITIDGYKLKKKCDEKELLEEAKLKAREVGGDAIKIVKYSPNYMLSGCAQMSIYILKLPEKKESN
jgi:hypothetical protein